MNYYWISINNRKVSSIAYAPEGTPVAHELIHDVVGKSMLPFPLELHSATDKDYLRIGGVSDLFFDFQPNSLAWPIMSERMKTIIESHLSGGECIEWKSVQIHGDKITRNYYIPCFMSYLDTLDVNQTVYAPISRVIIKPCFCRSKLENLAMFHGHNVFWQISTQIYVSEAIKKDLVKAGINEISYSKINIQ